MHYLDKTDIDEMEIKLEGLQKNFESEMPAEPHILRPEALRGHVSKIDPATALSASVAMRERLPQIDNERVDIILGARVGNHLLARQYGYRIRRQASSPVLFSTSGFSICAGLAAYSAKINGPSLVIAGKQSNWADCLIVASNYIARGDFSGASIIGSFGEKLYPGNELPLILEWCRSRLWGIETPRKLVIKKDLIV
ncbi:hypothetical protein [Paenibacillus sp. FSL H8-0537]|uniref:hypothetical protein n=1 Tax=Paenibacillus sp. FSL H8-0537 TaxID=2921399 RepID=UPI0031013F4E